MTRKKLIRSKEAIGFPNVFGLSKLTDFKFADKFSKKVLEIGCGHGLFAYQYAQKYSDVFVLGVDVKLDRMHKGASLALEEGLENLFFFRSPVCFLLRGMSDIKFDEIWITFPDPHEKKGAVGKRLTHETYLEIYRKLLAKGGSVFLKTDNPIMYNYTLGQIKRYGLEFEDFSDPCLNVPIDFMFETVFERKYLDKGLLIRRLRFGLKNSLT